MKKFILTITVLILAGSIHASSMKSKINTKVYTVFFSISKDLSSRILSDLEKKCEGIDFIGNKIISYNNDTSFKENNLTLRDIEIEKSKDLDGLMLFCSGNGFCDTRYLQTELPTIIIDCSPFMPQQLGYNYTTFQGKRIGFDNTVALAERFKTKFITATYPTPNSVYTKSEAEQILIDLKEKTNLFKVINKLKNSTIVTIQDHDGINIIDRGTRERPSYNPGPLTNYDLTYPNKLKEYFGIDLIIVRSDEVMQQLERVDGKEAEKIADIWINEATEVRNVERHDIVRAAKFYLAVKGLVKKYNADAITYESASLSGKLQAVFPLPILELSKYGIPACCQSHIDCQVTQLIGRYMTEGVGFVGDLLNDWGFEPIVDTRPKDVKIIGHCGAPIVLNGHNRIPYMIREHYISLHHKNFKPGNTPTAITVDWPANEKATLVKVDAYRKKISLFTGTVLDGDSLYKDFSNVSCRNKIVIKIDRPEDCYMLPTHSNAGMFREDDTWDNSEYTHFGCHQVVFYGNLRKRIRDLGTLLGCDVIEK